MDLKSAARLRLIGVFVVLASLLLIWLPMMTTAKLDYNEAIASTLAIGIGLLLIAEVGPLIKSLKAGGIEVEFLDTVNDKFNTLDKRVTALEMSALHPERHGPSASPPAPAPGPPGLSEEGKYQDDPQKGRFGGEAKRDGFELSATFRNVTKNFVEIVLRVTAPKDKGVEEADCVEFYLHDSFDPDVIPAVFREGVAELTLIAYGGFTVGAWIGCTQTQLELDLSKIKGAPRIIREL